jgi:ABC-type thiamine transport system substrate-binding protein
MTALTRTQIYNGVLREIGTYRVDDWADDDAAADVLTDNWEIARGNCLVMHDWHFARRLAQLTRLVATPDAQWDYFYGYPAAYVKLQRISVYESMQPELLDYELLGDGIATSTDYLYIAFTYDHDTVGQWPPYFSSLMIAELGALSCAPLKSETVRERFEKMKNDRLAKARTYDSMQNPSRKPPAGDWVNAARGMRTR